MTPDQGLSAQQRIDALLETVRELYAENAALRDTVEKFRTKQAKRNAVYDTPVEELHFSNRTAKRLAEVDVKFVGDLVQKKAADLLRIWGFGRLCLREVERALERLGLRLGSDLDDWKRP
jgi:DNA-directed RNA polymerase alpha subunit